jgi:hypothetical protein
LERRRHVSLEKIASVLTKEFITPWFYSNHSMSGY